MKTDGIKIVDLPKELKGTTPVERLLSLYEHFGWKKGEYLTPRHVHLYEEDIINYMIKEKELFPEASLEVGTIWVNYGPSGGGDKPGKAILHPGWRGVA